MCRRHHTNCSVESVSKRSATGPQIVFSTWRSSSGCRNFNVRVCTGHQDSEELFVMVWIMNQWNPHCSIYNIQHKKMGLFDNTRRPVKTDPVERVLMLSLSPPSPQEKPSKTSPETPPHQDLLITNVLSQGQIPWTVPIYESVVRTP
jgi:hypothetical protein